VGAADVGACACRRKWFTNVALESSKEIFSLHVDARPIASFSRQTLHVDCRRMWPFGHIFIVRYQLPVCRDDGAGQEQTGRRVSLWENSSMKRILFAGAFAFLAAGPALAADLPPPPAPPPRAPATYVPAPVPYYNWGGIYFGINGGYNFGTVSPSFPAPAVGTNFNTTGFLGGGTIGFNYQWAAIVAGLEGDWDYNSLSNSMPVGDGGGTFASNWLATARGRLGYAWDRILLFATGGAAFAPANISGAVAPGANGSTTMTGWTAGAGVEVAVAPNWTVKAEYLYINFLNPSIGGVGFKDTDNVIRAGVNFKFTL
jgi:outer membrane immunogenic protein